MSDGPGGDHPAGGGGFAAKERMEWTPERIERFWDYESRFPEFYYSFKFGPQILDRSVELLAHKGTLAADAVWLDFGCGFGSFSELLLARGYRVVVHDSSAESLETCRARLSGEPGFLGTLAAYPGAVDVVSLLEVVEHVTAEAMAGIVGELGERFGSGVRLLLSTPNGEDLEHPETTVYCPACDTVRHRWQHLRAFDRESLERHLRRLGLDEVYVREENFRRDKRLATRNPLRRLKRLLCEPALRDRSRRPNLLAVGRL